MAAHLGEQPDTVSVESEGSVSVESEDSMDETDSDQTTHKAAPQPYPPASTTFIELRHHPHSGILEPEFIFWDLPYDTTGFARNFEIHGSWIRDLVTDPSLSSSLILYPVKKFLHANGGITQIFDEINTGQTWWDIQEQLPYYPYLPHCFLPLHLWLDKGKVSSTVTMHPILLRPGFLPRAIQNGSGNRGAVLIGYMPRIVDPGDPDDPFGRFKRDIYHKILQKMLRSLEHISQEGEAVKCGDEIHHVFFPGIAIQSLDMEEAACACGTRAALADYPCTRCLVHKHQLHLVTKSFTLQTTKTMQSVYKQAINAHTKAASEDILKKNGLHKNTFWFIANSDPYIAHSYDLLHNDDSGKFGKHLFPLTIEVLEDLAKKGKYSQNMNMVPSWPNLNHFQSITTMEFSDAYACIRLIAGFHMISELQLNKLQEYLQEYKDYCKEVQELYGKVFNFSKQHALVHLTYDIIHKGSTINYDTLVGEGFQQEVKQAYHLTKFKKVEEQMTRIDENQEAIAHIGMAIDAYEKELKDRNAEAEEEKKAQHNTQAAQPQGHWKLGSPEKHTTGTKLKESNKGNMVFQNFHKNLLGFLRHIFPEGNLDSMPMKITPYKCIYISYQSLEDWSILQDIARCNPSFHNKPCYDYIIINTEPVSCGQLHFMFRCHLNTGPQDIAVIRRLKPSKWTPHTLWKNCHIYEEKDYGACHMIPTFDTRPRFYLNDLIDSDMFLRFGNCN
ncbi:hypothetical protein JB92DRAFT_3081531 [Gautieria morchelliformis]|nr:hypothetical protein JB92DRAFT_3081531 [Gautieria morchelliformis]